MKYLMRGAFVAALVSSPILFSAAQSLAAGDHAGGHGHGNRAIGEPGRAAAADRTIEVTMYDTYYEPEQIEVSGGETVRFLVRNEGTLVHEFNIATAAMHAAHQEEMAMMVEHGVLEADRINRERMDMGDGHTMAHDDPNSVLLEPGQTTELVWTFPQDGRLEFACNVPGHYEAGMVGTVEVEN